MHENIHLLAACKYFHRLQTRSYQDVSTAHQATLTTCTEIKLSPLAIKRRWYSCFTLRTLPPVSLCVFRVTSYLGLCHYPRVGLCLSLCVTRRFVSRSVCFPSLSVSLCFSSFSASVCLPSLPLLACPHPNKSQSSFSCFHISVILFLVVSFSQSLSLSSFPASVCFSSLPVSVCPFLVTSCLGLFPVAPYLDLSASHCLIFPQVCFSSFHISFCPFRFVSSSVLLILSCLVLFPRHCAARWGGGRPGCL
jgi:hypothetical protein